MQTIFVLYTTINGRKNYVATQMSNHNNDNKKIVNYTTDANNAKDFGSEEAASKFISRIFNPHERVFASDVVEVDESKLAAPLVEEDIK